MREVVSHTHVTLDGVMQSPGPDEDASNGFSHGGWVVPFRSPAAGKAVVEMVAGEFDMLLGRRTYENFSEFWPAQVDHPIGIAFNKARKFVVTSTLDRVEWEHSHILGGDVVDAVRRLKSSDGPPVHVWGSAILLRALISADLVDEYRMIVYPVVLGEGKRLFENGAPPRALTLVSSMSTPTGVLFNTYRVAGPVPKP